ncbi:MAG: hypothetical protein R3F34_12670 [Planctomycetota bacterium]
MNGADPLEELLADAGRTRIDGAREVVTVRDDDDAAFLDAVAKRGGAPIELVRRGRVHGRVVELDPRTTPRLSRPSQLRRRFAEARPVVLPGALAHELGRRRNELFESDRLHERLVDADSLRRHLERRLANSRRFTVARVVEGGADPERDLATAFVDDARAPRAGLWIKLGRLSTSADDASKRLRFGFGVEPDDDASGDPERHRALTTLAREALPELAWVESERGPFADVAVAAEAALGPVCPIVYWNRPNGGALMHHDGFAPVECDGQRGVLYTQLAGATVWLALSTSQLARRVREFAELLDAGEMDWVVDALAGSPVEDALRELAHDEFALAEELALPGQGRLGGLVELGPEFTAYLVDSGHAAVLHPGDAILLPNHGTRATALHSVFCGGGGPNLALSLGLRRREVTGAPRRRGR